MKNHCLKLSAIIFVILINLTGNSFSQTLIRIASVSGPTHHHNVALNWFAERVNKQNIGIEFKVFSGAQLGNDEREYIEGLEQGTIQMAQVSTGPIGSFIGEFDIFSLPYVFKNTDHFKKVLSGPIGQKYSKMLEKKGMVLIAWFDNGDRHVFNSKRPINKPSDLSGLKIRVIKSAVMVDTINAMGGSAVPMAYGELYTALQQGVLDGAENAAGNIFNDKFFEVSKFVSLTQHFRPPGVVVISKKTWDKLTDQQKKVILKEGAALQAYEIDLTTKIVEDSLKQLEQKGMKINKVDTNSFATAVKPVYNGYISKFGKQDLDAILNTK